MNKSIFCLLLAFPASVSLAQKSNFGMLDYTVPPGYELIRNNSVLTYFKENKGNGAYCNFFVYGIMEAKGSARQCFDFCWENLLQKPFKTSAAAVLQPEAELKGWRFLCGSTRYADNGVATLAMQFTFSRGQHMQNVIILSNSDSYKKDIEDFIAAADVATDAAAGNGQADTGKARLEDDRHQSGTVDNGLKPEVWMKSRFEYDMFKKLSETKFEWLAVYPDGKFYSYMPTEGFSGLYRKNTTWGKASWSGSRLNVTDASGNVYYFDKKSATKMQSKFDSKPNFYRSKPVDGLRIEGAYTQYAGLLPSSTNEAQYLIWFYKDGSFDDRGISVVDLKNPYAFPDSAPGKGKYNIENFSIFLRYDDGRVKQLGFSGFLDNDPATVTDAYFIGRLLYYRKDKGFNSKLK